MRAAYLTETERWNEAPPPTDLPYSISLQRFGPQPDFHQRASPRAFLSCGSSTA